MKEKYSELSWNIAIIYQDYFLKSLSVNEQRLAKQSKYDFDHPGNDLLQNGCFAGQLIVSLYLVRLYFNSIEIAFKNVFVICDLFNVIKSQ